LQFPPLQNSPAGRLHCVHPATSTIAHDFSGFNPTQVATNSPFGLRFFAPIVTLPERFELIRPAVSFTGNRLQNLTQWKSVNYLEN
jgi:hypothetical protein